MNECSCRHCCLEGVVSKHCGFSRHGWLISLSDSHPVANASFATLRMKTHLLSCFKFNISWALMSVRGCSSLLFINSQMYGSGSSKTASWSHNFSKTVIRLRAVCSVATLSQPNPALEVYVHHCCQTWSRGKEFHCDSWQAEMYMESFLAICFFKALLLNSCLRLLPAPRVPSCEVFH